MEAFALGLPVVALTATATPAAPTVAATSPAPPVGATPTSETIEESHP